MKYFKPFPIASARNHTQNTALKILLTQSCGDFRATDNSPGFNDFSKMRHVQQQLNMKHFIFLVQNLLARHC